jgi:hypothetical protein
MTRIVALLFLLIGAPMLADGHSAVYEFSGRAQQRTGAFEAQSPWMVTWQTKYHDVSPALGRFEVYLYSAATDDFLGVVTLWYGAGTGDVLIERSGRFYFKVLGYSDGWFLRVREIDAAEAARARAAAEVARFKPPPRHGVARQQIGPIRSWRIDQGPTLVIESVDGRSFRAIFPDGCPGLDEADSLQMISGSDRDWDHYTGVLLDNGQVCEFGQVVADPRTGP